MTVPPRRGPGGMTISATPAGHLLAFRQHVLVFLDARLAFGLPGAGAGLDPFGLGGERALPGRFLLFLLLQALALLLQPRGVVALERVAAAALDLENPVGDVLEEVAVMGHHQHGAGIVAQGLFQPGHALRVQMVGRLVQQQHVGLFQQQAAQRHAPLLAARQMRHRAVRRRAAQRIERDLDPAFQFPAVLGVDLLLQVRLLGEQRVHLLLVHRLGELVGDFVEPVECRTQRAECLLHVFGDGLGLVELRFLGEVPDARALGGPGLAAVFGLDPGHDLQQRRLAGAVDAQHADLHAGQERQGDALEDLASAGERLGEVLHDIDVLVGGHGLAPAKRRMR